MLKITSDAIIYGNQMYPAKNISSARMVQRDIWHGEGFARWFRRLALRVLLFVVILVGAGLLAQFALRASWRPYSDPMRNLSLAGYAVWPLRILGGILVLFALLPRKTKGLEYGVELQTNAGSTSLFWSQDRSFIEQVRDLIFKALASSSGSVSYSVNIDQRQLVDNSQTQINHSVTNNYDFSVNVAHHNGLTPEQMGFLTGEFSRALSEIARQAPEAEREDILAELKSLKDAVERENPDPGMMKKAYGRLKGLCDVYGVSETLVKTVGAGIALFA